MENTKEFAATICLLDQSFGDMNTIKMKSVHQCSKEKAYKKSDCW